ncbi:MAG TPA: hypothetical protein VMI31_08805 [Fimbriimonadaceae bacterium]|nr:hypothetical protein [Fimbriimonadaceae bacterium]
MRNVHLSDQVYQDARRAAKAAGFENVDLYVAEAVRKYLQTEVESEVGFFTPEILAEIDRGVDDIEAGRTLSSEEVGASLARHKAKWLEDRAS